MPMERLRKLETLMAEINRRPLGIELCDDPEAIDRLERNCDHLLPEDLKAFYRCFRGVTIVDTEQELDWGCYRCRFVPVAQIHRTRIDICGPFNDDDSWGPSAWITVGDISDGNYVALDLASGNGMERNYILCDHEVFAEPGESPIIARSFTELVERVLHGPPFWVGGSGYMTYGDALSLTLETASSRIDNEDAPRKGWSVRFTSKGQPYSGFFADDDYGGKEQSLAEVRRVVERAIAESEGR